MNTEDFNNGDKVLIRFTDYIKSDSDVKPVKVVKVLEATINIGRGDKREITLSDTLGRCILKNFKKDSSVKGSFGMIRYKNTWLNLAVEVIGGLDAIREYKLEKLI